MMTEGMAQWLHRANIKGMLREGKGGEEEHDRHRHHVWHYGDDDDDDDDDIL